MKEDIKCIKCSGQMIVGYIFDEHSPNSYSKPKWATDVNYSFFEAKFKNKQDVITYCCSICGYLESYAKELVEGGE